MVVIWRKTKVLLNDILTFLIAGVGYSMLIISFLVSIYYNTIIAWVLYYLFESFRADVPWRDCKNSWNTESCYEGPPPNSIVHPLNNTANGTSVLSCPKNFAKMLNGSLVVNATQDSLFDMCKFQRPEIRILPAEQFLE